MFDLREGLQQTLGPAFKIERELTGGGMSRVFVALDTSLGRRVVVKVLPADLAATVSVDRFKREIMLAATLQHPHIVGVLTAGEIDGMPYFTMPYVEGESLRARIEREGRLSVGRTVSILKDVARALAYAHERGVVHRDIKPDNVLLAGTSATVTDFGIAKALLGALTTDAQPAGTKTSETTGTSKSALTQLGTTLGTPAYMAPEQAAADPATDHRADLYSFGIMAYEMLVGQVPFRSKTPQALLAAQLTATPAPIPTRRTDVPGALARLVMQCLEKEREKRPQSASELAELLEHPDMVSGAFASAPMQAVRRRNALVIGAAAIVAVGALVGGWLVARQRVQSSERTSDQAAVGRASAAVAERARSIVVLPFVNIGRDSTDVYLADGLTNDLINVLGRVPGIRVTSRTVATSAREKFTSASEIGKALNVGRILEGTVQREGTRLRVTARVTNTDDGFMVWSDMFERQLKDVFAVQDEISRAIAEALGAQMGAVATAAVVERGTNDDVAYDLYLRGRHFFEQRGVGPLRRALDLFKRAAEKDPGFARAYAGIAGVHSVLPLYAHIPIDSVFGPGFEAATKAIQLDSSLAEAYASRAVLLNGRWRWRESEEDFVRAIALDPRYAAAHQWYGEHLMIRYRLKESVDHLKRAADLDPVSPIIGSSYSMALGLSGRNADAVAQARRAVELDSTLFLPRLVLGLAHVMANRHADAIRELEPALALSGGSPFVQAMLGYAYAVGGQRQNAEALAQQLTARRDADAHGALAIVHLGLGDTTRALTSLETAARAHAPFFTVQAMGAPVFDPVRRSARFQAVVRTLGLQ
jgi:TolB-like protein/tetratricopeptide (TPR) repeat protein